MRNAGCFNKLFKLLDKAYAAVIDYLRWISISAILKERNVKIGKQTSR